MHAPPEYYHVPPARPASNVGNDSLAIRSLTAYYHVLLRLRKCCQEHVWVVVFNVVHYIVSLLYLKKSTLTDVYVHYILDIYCSF